MFQEASWAYKVLKDVFAHVSIHSRQRVIQQIDILIMVNGARKRHPLFLSTGEINALANEMCNNALKIKLYVLILPDQTRGQTRGQCVVFRQCNTYNNYI